jgi:hypothetical protein
VTVMAMNQGLMPTLGAGRLNGTAGVNVALTSVFSLR